MRNNKIFIVCMLMIAGILAGCSNGAVRMTVKEDSVLEDKEAGSDETLEKASEESETVEETSESDCIYVYVCGHVANPGVYALDRQDRICDAIVLAGGIIEDGCGEVLNQAEHMTDGQTLYVPGIDEIESPGKITDSAQNQEDGKVNINTATKEELMTLTGIGEAKADMIIQYREEHGAFDSIEGLMEIPGIKEGVYNKIKSEIKVS